jgi:hypothetical protein
MALLVALLATVSIAFYLPYFPQRFADFRAFYCAGQATRTHADPYREHPLHECERAARAPGISAMRNDVTTPAPFPGPTLALFALIAVVPFGLAALLWLLATAVATVLAIVLLARVTHTSRAAVAIALGFPALTVALPFGQLTPLLMLALAACATALHAGRPRLAALAALATALDPHIGLALGIALFVCIARTRLTLLAGAFVLGLLSVALLGPARNIEYLREVLPAHALANLSEHAQFSTANILASVGVPAPVALIAGNLWYLAMIALGIVVAVRLRPRYGDVAVALVPPAFAVFGGVHIHLQQLALAIPAFFLIAPALQGTLRAWFVATISVAAVPWLLIAPFPMLFPLVGVLAVVFARRMAVPRIAFPLGLAMFTAATGMFVAVAGTRHAGDAISATPPGNPLAEVSWSGYVTALNAQPDPWLWFLKAPTFCAFAIAFGIIVARLRSKRYNSSSP